MALSTTTLESIRLTQTTGKIPKVYAVATVKASYQFEDAFHTRTLSIPSRGFSGAGGVMDPSVQERAYGDLFGILSALLIDVTGFNAMKA